jgi:hypothetical protein
VLWQPINQSVIGPDGLPVDLAAKTGGATPDPNGGEPPAGP